MQMNDESDADLRKRFRELREQDGTPTPDFDHVLTRASPRSRRSRPGTLGIAGGFVLMTAVGFFLFLRPPETSTDALAVSLPPWPRQTDFLLAAGSDPSQQVSWSPSPTSGLGQPSFSRYPEAR
jgi:hypothetical protein